MYREREGKETGTQINDLDQKEEINIQPEQNEETRIQNNEKRLRNLRDKFKHSKTRIIGLPEREKEEQEVKNLFENNEGELPQSGKGNRLPGSPGSPENPKEVGPKEEHTKAHHNYISQDETEGENLRSSKSKGHSYLQRSSCKTVS